ncbi:MAG: histidine triad (HIT) family protein [Lysobacterales bacterium]|jgi:histidine triad (HIT) family protein
MTLFTKILNGEVPCHKLAEDDNYFSFLDIRPINPGHALTIPKKEVDYIFDHDDQTISGLMIFSKKIALAIAKVVPQKRVGIMVAGLEVPHTHIHLVPIDNVSDLSFSNGKEANFDELVAMAKQIREHL